LASPGVSDLIQNDSSDIQKCSVLTFSDIWILNEHFDEELCVGQISPPVFGHFSETKRQPHSRAPSLSKKKERSKFQLEIIQNI
jgi:hypothetical protein